MLGGLWYFGVKHTKGIAARRPLGEARNPGRGQRSGTPKGRGFALGSHPLPGFGSRLPAKGLGVRLRPGWKETPGTRLSVAEGCAPRALLVSVELQMPVLSQEGRALGLLLAGQF